MRGRKRHRKKAAKKAAERRRSRIRTITVGFTFRADGAAAQRAKMMVAAMASHDAFRAQLEEVARIANAGREGLEALGRQIKREQIVRDLAGRTTWSASNVRWLLHELEREGLPTCGHLAERLIQSWEAGAPIGPALLSQMIRATLHVPHKSPDSKRG